MKIFSVNVNNNIFWGRKLNDNICCRFSRQMYNRKLPDVNLSLDGWLLSENLTCCIFLKWKNDAFNTTLNKYFFKSQIWRVVNLSNGNLTRIEVFNWKLYFLKKHQKWKICLFHGVKWTKTWFFGCKHFFKTWHVQKILIQNLTRCVFFNPKSDALWNF